MCLVITATLEPHVDDIPVPHHVVPSLEPLLPPLTQYDIRSGVEQLLRVAHLSANEAARDIRVDARSGVERGLALAKIPRAHLGVARGEERDEPQQLVRTAGDAEQTRLLETEVVQESSAIGGVQLGDVVLDARRYRDHVTASQ